MNKILSHTLTTAAASFVSRVLADKEMPVENVKLINVKALNVRDKKHIHENLKNFSEK